MVRTVLAALLVILPGTAAAEPMGALLPTGGVWQGVPYPAGEIRAAPARPAAAPPHHAAPNRAAPDRTALDRRALDRRAHRRPEAISYRRKLRRAAKAAPAAGPRAHAPRRHAVAAAAPAAPGRLGPAARARELSRRIAILAPGMTLGHPVFDPENPPWRHKDPGRAGPDGRAFSMPFDDSGRAGFVARGYREEPSWDNPNGNTGATFGVRTKF